MLVGVIVLGVLFGFGLMAFADDPKTCKDLGYADNLTASSSGVWGSATFDDTQPTLTLVVNEGYEVTLCVKAGSENQGFGPEEVGPFGEGEYAVPHSSGKELSHYGVAFSEIPDDSTTTTLVDETTTTTVDDSTTTTQADDDGTTTTVGETTTTAQVTTTDPGTTTTDPGTSEDADELPFTGIPSMVFVALGSALIATGGYLVRRFRTQ
jgi:hypothetical protein